MKTRIAFHPFLFVAYAVLGVYQINANFESNLPYLVDKIFYATWNGSCQFLDVTNEVGQACILSDTSGESNFQPDKSMSNSFSKFH